MSGVAPLSATSGQMVQLLPLVASGTCTNNSPVPFPEVKMLVLLPAIIQRLLLPRIKPPLPRVRVQPPLTVKSFNWFSELTVALALRVVAPDAFSQFWADAPAPEVVRLDTSV